VHALRPDVARDRLGEDALRRLRGHEGRAARLAAQRGGVSRDDESAAPARDHVGEQRPRQVQQRHDVDAKVALEVCGVDVEEGAERSRYGVVDDDRRIAERRAHVLEHPGEHPGVRDVAGERPAPGQLGLELGEAIGTAGEHRDAIAAARETPRHGRSGSGAHSRDETHRAVVGHRPDDTRLGRG
jgi:hypothetical protein